MFCERCGEPEWIMANGKRKRFRPEKNRTFICGKCVCKAAGLTQPVKKEVDPENRKPRKKKLKKKATISTSNHHADLEKYKAKMRSKKTIVRKSVTKKPKRKAIKK